MNEKERKFQTTVRAQPRRSFAWRRTRNPYRIMVSEFMLQQTQTARVEKFYPLFLKHFPDVCSLAKASLADVLQIWQGLGYNRRAKFLRSAAQAIVEWHGGKVPADEASLVALPGIGKNTAGAIMAFAFNQPVIFIETNIRRAFIHHFFLKRDVVLDENILLLIERTLDRQQSREWYCALMDYGAALGRDRKLENPNRRSRAYNRQSIFEGSDRQVRGEIIRILLREKNIAINELQRRLGIAVRRRRTILENLRQEGIVEIREGKISLGR